MPAWHVRDYLGEAVWCYFKFGFDRNPWDRQVSWYLYKTKSKRARPSFECFMASRARVYVDNYQLEAATTSRGRPRRPFPRPPREAGRGSQRGARTRRRRAARYAPAHQHHPEQGRVPPLPELLLARDAGAGRRVVSARDRASGLRVLRVRPCRVTARCPARRQKWWAREGLNLQPDGYEPPALTS